MKIVKKKSSSKLLDRAKPVGEIENYTSMLIYGASGTGKTAFASTCPKPAILLDLREKGTETIAKVPDIKVLEIDTWQEFEAVYWELKDDDEYRTIILDQITSLQGIAMQKIREDNNYEEKDTFTQRDWGRLSGMMQTWLLNYRNLFNGEKHILFLAHQRAFDTEEGENNQIAPHVGARLSPSVEDFMNGAVSVIGNTFIRERTDKKTKEREVSYCMRLGPHGSYRSKIRVPPGSVDVPDVLVNPTFEKIMKLSRGEAISKIKRK